MTDQRRAAILLHPIRLRLVLALGAQHLTTAQLAERLPDVPHATLYRHVAALVSAGMLEVVDERRVRGSVERTYALVSEAASMGPADVVDASPDELFAGFVAYSGALIEAFGRYAADPHARPSQDLLTYRQVSLWLDPDERSEFLERLRSAIAPFVANEPRSGRALVRLGTVLIPERPNPPPTAEE